MRTDRLSPRHVLLGAGINLLVLTVPTLCFRSLVEIADLRYWLLVGLATLFCVSESASTCFVNESRRCSTWAEVWHRHLAYLSGLVLLGMLWTSLANVVTTSWLSIVAGCLLMLSGVALRRLAVQGLGEQFRSEIDVRHQRRLVTDGIFRLVRHPSETGLCLVAMGVAAFAPSNWTLLLSCTVAGLVIARVRLEEAELKALFGSEYIDYCRQTPALVPRLVYASARSASSTC